MMKPTRFSTAIMASTNTGYLTVIPDIKCRSPKEGDLLRGRDPIETAKTLVNCGAPVVSVVTEKKDFGGSLGLLRDIANTVNVPVLRKDFITTADEIKRTVEHGASAVLLICAYLNDKTLFALYDTALNFGVEPLVEVHNEAEMNIAKRVGAHFIAINNRNIVDFERDNGGPELTISLSNSIPKDVVLISASGINTPDEAASLAKAGVHGILVGTALWLADDMYETYKSLCVESR